jgi:hypothetical protein
VDRRGNGNAEGAIPPCSEKITILRRDPKTKKPTSPRVIDVF